MTTQPLDSSAVPELSPQSSVLSPQTSPGAADYRVELDAYNGPLDLLLYLIRREEVDIYDIPIATITARFVEHVELLKQMDPDAIGEFLVMAATLMEIKSRTLLPHPPAEVQEDEFGDPRLELVQQLLEYKKFKDAARGLGVAAEIQALKHPRYPAVPPLESDHVDIEHVQLWDLVEAFRRLLEQTGLRQISHDVVYDDTPIALHAADVLDALERGGGLQLFEAIFAGRGKSQMIGLFLALLELIRQKRIRACQEYPFGPISIELLDATPIRVDEERAAGFTPAPDDTPIRANEETIDASTDNAAFEPAENAAIDDESEPLASEADPEPDVDANPEVQPTTTAVPERAPAKSPVHWPWASPFRKREDQAPKVESAIRTLRPAQGPVGEPAEPPHSALNGGSS